MKQKIIGILPTHSRCEMLPRALSSVVAQAHRPDLFLILDNASTDGSDKVLKSFADKHDFIKIIRSEKNLGASGGMRFLMERALEMGADWVWFMDDDAEVDSKALDMLLKSSAVNNPEAYILEMAVLDANGVWTPHNRPSLFNEDRFDFQGLEESAIHSDEPIEVHTGGYNGWFVRRSCFEEFGFPRSDMYFWFDDIEYVVRVSRKKKVFLVPKAKVKHFATSLVEYEVRWPFSGPLPKIPAEHMERYFYWNRNWLWFAKQWLPAHKYAVFWAKHVARGLAAPVLFKQDDLVKRWKFVVEAGLDAAKNKLGKKEGFR